MRSVREAIGRSWFPQLLVLNADLGAAVGLDAPTSLTALTQHLDQPEVLRQVFALDRRALHGTAELIVRSDGSWTLQGQMRATGFPSFKYRVRIFLRSAPGIALACEASGRVFGTDTPGDRRRSWRIEGHNVHVARHWWSLRATPSFELAFEHELAGVTGIALDVVSTAAQLWAAATAGGPVAALIVLSANVAADDGWIGEPAALFGITLGAGVLLVCGPFALTSAVIAGGIGAAALSQVKHRRLNKDERALATRVFGSSLPLDKIHLTDLSHPIKSNGVAREFTMPAIDGSIVIGMGCNYEHTLEPDVQGRYPAPGQVLIHELVHAWQIEHSPVVPWFVCDALVHRNYKFDQAMVDRQVPWRQFEPEEQATIVDSWYRRYAYPAPNMFDFELPGLDRDDAMSDKRFIYIQDYLRAGLP
jgi:hypothetical protein